MRKMSGAFGLTIGFAMVCAFMAVVVALILFLAARQIPELSSGMEDIRCVLGIPAQGSPCVRDEIEALTKARSNIEAERNALARKIEETEKRRAELEALNNSVENYSLFESENLSFGSVTTGVKFTSVLEPEIWSSAWCYLSIDTGGAASTRIDLGRKTRGQAISHAEITGAILRDTGLTPTQIAQAREACAWPDGERP